LDVSQKYFVELILEGGANIIQQSMPKAVVDPMGFEKNTVNLKDLRTLPVNNTKVEKTLTMRLMNSKNEEVARSQIKVLERFYVSPNEMTEMKAQKFDIVQAPKDGTPLDDTKKGSLNMKIRYVPSEAPVSSVPAKEVPEEKKEEQFEPAPAQVKLAE